jgi:IS30 family transposase
MRLQRMAEHQMPAAKIARQLRRSEAAVRTEARKQRVMLAPPEKQLSLTDKRPYGGLRVQPRRSVARSEQPARRDVARSKPPQQSETLF